MSPLRSEELPRATRAWPAWRARIAPRIVRALTMNGASGGGAAAPSATAAPAAEAGVLQATSATAASAALGGAAPHPAKPHPALAAAPAAGGKENAV